jgi:hypothetical protein
MTNLACVEGSGTDRYGDGSAIRVDPGDPAE